MTSETINDSKQNDMMLIWMIVIACFMALYNSTAMNAGLPMFIEIFDASVTEVQWIMIGYTVIMGVCSPLSSWFVHRFTLRNYFVYSMVVFAVLSLASGLSTNVYFLIVARGIQGIAGSALIPVTMIAIYRFVTRNKQPFFLTIQNMSLSLGPAIGPVIAGVLLVYASWRWLFWINVPLSMIAIYLGLRVLPKEKPSHVDKLDGISLVTIVIGCLLVLLAFSLGSDYGLLSPIILGMIIVGSALCGYFTYRQGHLKEPILSFKPLKYREFSISLLVNTLLSMALCIAPFVLAIYLQTVRGYSAFDYGVLLLIPAIFSIGGAPISQRLYGRFSSKALVGAGLLFLSAGSILLGTSSKESSVVLFIVFLCMRYLGIGLMGMPVTDHGMRALPKELQDDGSTLINWLKLMASSLSLSVFTMVYAMVSTDVEKAGGVIEAMVRGVDWVFISSGVMLACGLVLTLMFKEEKE